MPYGTDLKSLKAIFKVSTGASVKIGSTIQTSGTTINTFVTMVTYSLIAQNGLVQNYKVNVTVAKNTEKAISSFSFNELNPIVLANINGYSISATVPYGTNRTNLIATFTASEKAILKVGQTSQVSGTTKNDFRNSLVYTVMAEDSSTQDYLVIVNEAPAPKSSEKEILSFSFNNFSPIVFAKINGSLITATVPFGTNRTNLIATFTVSPKAIVKVGQITQVSGITSNDFTITMKYSVTAEDGTSQDYTLTVIEAPASKSSEKSITSFSFEGLNPIVIGTISGTNITATIPYNIDITKLIASFTVSIKAKVNIGQITQLSDITVNDFSNPLTYTVTAEDGTVQNYVVNVSIEKKGVSGITILTKNNLVYPNPNNGEFLINAEAGELNIQIKDLQGKIVFQKSILNYQGEKIYIDVKDITSSILFVHIFNNSTETINKIEVLK